MKLFIIFFIFINTSLASFSQRLSKVTINNNGFTESFSVAVDENVLINFSPNGDLINYGVEYFSERISNYSRVENYTGRTEVYNAYEDKAFQGKVK